MTLVIDRITSAWRDKASVRFWYPTFEGGEALDYPLSCLPECEIGDRARFEARKASIATSLWLQYNWRTIQAEERIAAPAIDLLLRSRAIRGQVKEALMQTAVDEKFHTLFHSLAMRSAEERAEQPMRYVDSVTVRELDEAMAAEPEEWKRELIQIAYGAVAEVSVNAFLEVLSRSPDIRSCNRELVDKHNRDERLHSSIFVEAVKDLLASGDTRARDGLREQIVRAKTSFLKHDFSMYEHVFAAHGIECAFSHASDTMSRDMSGINRLLGTIE